MPNKLEICVDTIEALRRCDVAHVDTVELCSNLDAGGLTPSYGMLKSALPMKSKTHVLIRPRAGGFVYTEGEIAAMCDDIEMVRDLGFAGIVIGAQTESLALSCDTVGKLISCAGDMQLTLHRVIDLIPQPLAALDQALSLGFDRVLTSGQQKSAFEGAGLIAQMQKDFGGRIEVVVGGGVRCDNIAELARKTKAVSFHSSARFGATQTALSYGLGVELNTSIIEKNISDLNCALNS